MDQDFIDKMSEGNEQERYLKIPVGLNTLKRKQVNLYVAFIELKTFNSEGKIDPRLFADPKIYSKGCKRYFLYWLAQLEKVGWVIKKGNFFYLKTYHEIWRLLGVTRCYNRKDGRHHFKYVKISCSHLPDDQRKCVEALREIVYRHFIDRKLKQVIHQASQSAVKSSSKAQKSNSNLKVFITCSQFAGWLGNSSRSTASKLRKQFLSNLIQPEGFEPYNGTITQCRRKAGYVLI